MRIKEPEKKNFAGASLQVNIEGMGIWAAIAGVTTVCLAAVSFSVQSGSTYRYSFFFLTAMVWALVWFRRKLALHPFHFALFCSAVLLHDLGAFGLYRRKFAGLEFDFYVHTWFGFVAAFMLYRLFWRRFNLSGCGLWTAVIICILGTGAAHELMEYSTNLMLGPEKGMLKPDIAGPFDTQEDLAHNLFGALSAWILYTLYRRFVPSAGGPDDFRPRTDIKPGETKQTPGRSDRVGQQPGA